MLTHYTRTSEAVGNILRHGFAWIANRRNLVELLIPQHNYQRREPQQFGMVSFTETPASESLAHRSKFGSFGITVSEEWARSKAAQRVYYVEPEGPVVEALKALFQIGYEDVRDRISFPDDTFWTMAYENKGVAGSVAGSALWANLLQVWEYLEPSSSAAQREWRIVNPKPLYSLAEDKAKAISQVSPPKGWASFTNVLIFQRPDILEFVCPESGISALASQLPSEYRDVRVVAIAG